MTQLSTNPESQADRDAVRSLQHHLRAACARVKLVVVMRSLLLCLSVLSAAIAALILIDFVFRLPAGVRVVTLGGLVYLGVRLWKHSVAPAARLRVSPSDMALQIECRDPSVRGLLASAIDLSAEANEGEPAENDEWIGSALRHAALATLVRRLNGRTLPTIVSVRELSRALMIFLVLGSIVGLGAMRSPEHARIGLRRVLLPLGDARWPMRFAIVDTTETSARAIDIAVPIRVLIGSSHSPTNANPEGIVRWRVLDDRGQAISGWTKTMLIAQGRRDEQSKAPIFEQLIDTQSAAAGYDEQHFTLEYRIKTRDDESAVSTIALVRPPELVETSVEISLPLYAEPIAGTGLVRSGLIKVPGSDAALSPMLAGSRAIVRWRFSKPIGFPTDMTPGWVSAVAQENTIVRFEHPSPETIELELVAGASVSIEPGVRDEMGIAVRTPIVLRLGVLDDLDPGASVTEPSRDEAVSTHAMIELSGELSDDFGLARGALRAVHARPPTESEGAPPEALGEPIGLETIRFEKIERVPPVRATLTHAFDLRTLDLSPGDEIWINAIAWDLRASDGQSSSETIGAGQSGIRVLRIVSDEQIVEQIRTGLNPVRNALRQLDDQQARLIEQLRSGDAATGQDQRALGDRIDANLRAIEQMGNSLERNTIDDPGLASLLDDAAAVLDEASNASQRASEQIARGQDQRAQEHQKKVRDRIGELLSMLDRGQDSWLALRSLEQLRDELAAIRDDTAALNKATAGQSLDQLSPEDRTALDRILERQLASADDADKALAKLEERSEQLSENDPTQGEALARAAAQGRSAELEEQLRKAGEQISSNQTGSATQTQSDVLEELDEMLEELKNTINNRDNALRRELASIIDSIKALIGAQESEIDRLGRVQTGQHPDDLAILDDRLIALVGNTLVVRDEALGAFPETRSIADLVTKASNAQSQAINALRQSPPALGDTDRAERAGLLHLENALKEAERLDEQAADRQARRQRAELRDQYRAALEVQAALRDETAPMIDQPLDRRQRSSARALGSAQDEIRIGLGELLEKTEELGDAPVFALAHDQLDRFMEQSSIGLNQRSIEARVLASQNASLAILSTLVEVLDESPPQSEPEDFDDGSSGGSQGGSSGGGDEPVIPPIAQLKLLRSMQQLAAMQTRVYSENPAGSDEADIAALAELQGQLFEHARQLIEDMSPSPEPKPVPVPDGHQDPPIDSDTGNSQP
jgi:hypothetical protein